MTRFISSSIAVPALLAVFSAGAALASGPTEPVYQPPMTVAAPIATYDWGGAYVGVTIASPTGDNVWSERSIGATAEPGDWSGHPWGVTFGYDMQSGPMVYGAAFDYSGSTLTANGATSGTFGCSASNVCSTEVSDVYNLRGRIGRAFDRTLVYGTLGFASGAATGTATVATGSDRLNGWVAGLGVEHALTTSFSVNLEYLHTDLGRLELPGGGCSVDCFTDVAYGQVRLGANFRF
ncbi:outer membrane protein [Pararhodobacter zhoushanensis]|uniref:Outer membrane beta-barrel protein n=1 Tax=Pararhodobacter zhoushanensis TaxID=2479545 RepID=A0ABT3GYE0_9RHOB|nr:outer membrane beta-barrel protein [Pararhodobacter zhoushanensis]MCW1932542.1 outer membrane beta-barrel protein [Pararhodobacter zhoushanensis]